MINYLEKIKILKPAAGLILHSPNFKSNKKLSLVSYYLSNLHKN